MRLPTVKIKNYHWALLANVTAAIGSWLILVVIVRLGTQDDVAEFAYAQAILLPIHLFFTLKLRTVQSADAKKRWTAEEYHLVRWLSAILSIFVSVVALSMFEVDWAVFVVGSFLAITYGLAIVNETPITLFQKNNRNDLFFFGNFFGASVTIVFFFLGFYFFHTLTAAVLFFVAAKVIGYIYYLLLMKKNMAVISVRWWENVRFRREIIITAFPLGLTALMGSLFTAIPRVVIKDNLGDSALAVYVVLTSLLVAFNLLVNSFVQSALPNLAKDYIVDYGSFMLKIRKAILRLIALSVLVSVVVYFFGEIALLVFFGKEYSMYSQELLLVIVSGSALSLLSISNLMLSAQNSFSIQFWVYSFCAGVIYFSSMYGVINFGLPGAILSQATGYSCGAILCLVYFYFRRRNDFLRE